MKGAYLGGGGGRTWNDASPRRRCPVCEGSSWCQIARDGETVLCKRVESPVSRENSEGNTYYVHHQNGTWKSRPRAEAPSPLCERPSVDVLDRAYRAVLGHLGLDASDRENLSRRGLDAEHIDRGAYGSLGISGRAALARVVVDAVGEENARRVPGIVRREADGRSWLSFAGDAGLVVPVRDVAGLVVALKVRRREAGEGPRYRYVTSARAGGASAASVVHWPVSAPRQASRVGVTEGELKADVASVLAGFPFLSLPGVGAWRKASEALGALGAHEVVVALDRDEAGARTSVQLVDALRAEGFAVRAWSWDRAHKGIDDFLNAQRTKETGT